MRSHFDYDVALLKLEDEVPLSNSTGFACLPSRESATESFQQKKLLVSGWGANKHNGPPQNTLKAAFVNGFSMNDCKLHLQHLVTFKTYNRE